MDPGKVVSAIILATLRKKTYRHGQVMYVSPDRQAHLIPRSATVMPSDGEESSHSRYPRTS